MQNEAPEPKSQSRFSPTIPVFLGDESGTTSNRPNSAADLCAPDFIINTSSLHVKPDKNYTTGTFTFLA